MRLCDGPGGAKNPLGSILSTSSPAPHETRSTKAGDLLLPLRIRAECFMGYARKLYYEVPELRLAPSLSAPKRVAKSTPVPSPSSHLRYTLPYIHDSDFTFRVTLEWAIAIFSFWAILEWAIL